MSRLFSILLLSLMFSSFAQGEQQAEQIFKHYAPYLYQIRLIDKASGEKSSIGSGFQISEDGLIATNYHVVSGFARFPDKYRMEYLDSTGNKAPLILQSVDVINDLAIVKREVTSPMAFIPIANKAPIKGEQIYSLGNPHDLGMIVVPGTYNGLKADSFNDKIHFTGSINPGMSGGPVVNEQGEVVGINVSTSGNSIGFLVPHDKLAKLYVTLKTQGVIETQQQILQQLNQNQAKLIAALQQAKWQVKPLADGQIPIVQVPFMRCWGNSNADKPDAVALAVVANCSLDEEVYLEDNFITQTIDMEFKYLKSRKLSPMKFYRLYEQQISKAGPNNKTNKDDVTEFQCHHDLVAPSNHKATEKAIFCTRAYKKFPSLYDVLYISATVDKNEQALISHFTLAGVTQQSAMAFTKRFMEAVSWQ